MLLIDIATVNLLQTLNENQQITSNPGIRKTKALYAKLLCWAKADYVPLQCNEVDETELARIRLQPS